MWERVRLSLAALGAAQLLGSEVSGEVHHPRLLVSWLAARSCSIHTLSICILNDAAAVHMTEGCVPPCPKRPDMRCHLLVPQTLLFQVCPKSQVLTTMPPSSMWTSPA